jgi:ketosteroid isomerase-like protein
MQRPNIDIVRSGFDAFNKGELDRLLALTEAEAFEIEVPPGLSAEPDTYRGREGVRRYYQSFHDAMSDIRFHVDRFWDRGDAVVVDMRVTAKGKQTSIPVEQRAAQVWTIRDGRAVRIQAYPSLAEALESVGLAE